MIDSIYSKESATTSIQTNIPNLLNYVRFFILIYVMTIMSKSPFKSFFLTWLAGSIDMLDGYFARKYNQSSKFGAMLDFGMDRFTTIMQFFYLASVYPKFWFIFLLINSVELIRDIVLANLNMYEYMLNLLEKTETEKDLNKIKNSLYDGLGISYSKQSEINSTSPGLKIDSHDINLIQYVNYYIWYSSDVFFWLIYFGSFIGQSSLPTSKTSLDESSNSSNSNRIRKIDLVKKLKILIYESMIFLDELAKFIQGNLTNILNNVSPLLKLVLAFLIRFVIFACLIGSLLRFITNTNALKNCLLDFIQLDYKKNQLTSL